MQCDAEVGGGGDAREAETVPRGQAVRPRRLVGPRQGEWAGSRFALFAARVVPVRVWETEDAAHEHGDLVSRAVVLLGELCRPRGSDRNGERSVFRPQDRHGHAFFGEVCPPSNSFRHGALEPLLQPEYA
eukprot:10508498-Heterocapsa_arctica.AAC.1